MCVFQMGANTRRYQRSRRSSSDWASKPNSVYISALLKDDAELYKQQFSDNPDFKRWLTDMVFFDDVWRSGTRLGNAA
jgi:hypothetical protein